jgi:hypothetical protein
MVGNIVNTLRFENRMTHSKDWVLAALNRMLREHPDLQQDVVGIEYTYYGFPSPINLQNLFGEKFERTFHPMLASAIEEIKSDDIKKDELHRFLLHKYLGIDIDDVEAQSFRDQIEPNAFHSIPTTEEEDEFLHMYFLQPCRLFNINPNNRTYRRENAANDNREWLWVSEAGFDSAPVFRKMIQLYIVSAILEDYVQENNPYRDEAIVPRLDQLDAVSESLKEDITQTLSELNNVSPLLENRVRGNPMGLLGSVGRTVSEIAPGFLDIASFYPVGRLLLGQPRSEPHDLIASNAVRGNGRQIFKYAFYWLFTHLNLSTSLFWVKTSFHFLNSMFQKLREYITDPRTPIEGLLLRSVLAIPGLFILALSPLLIIFPFVYGITSIPFSLIRSLCLKGPFPRLRDFNVLRGIDVVELIKDAALFCLYIVPAFQIILAAVTAMMPAPLLTAGLITSFSLLFIVRLYLKLQAQNNEYDPNWIQDIYSLASTNFFRFFGSALIMSLGVYIGVGVAGRRLYPNLPAMPQRAQRWSSAFGRMLSPLTRLFNAAERPEERQFENIIHADQRQEAMAPPKDRHSWFSADMEARRDDLQRRLGQLNQSPNMMIEPSHRKIFTDARNSLEVSADTTREAFEKAVRVAEELLANNLEPEEIDRLSHLVEDLGVGRENSLEIRAMAMASQNHRSYQPTWKLLNSVKDRVPVEGNQALLAKFDNILSQQLAPGM